MIRLPAQSFGNFGRIEFRVANSEDDGIALADSVFRGAIESGFYLCLCDHSASPRW